MKEIAKLEALGDPSLQLADIHTVESDGSLPDRDTLLRQLHLRTADDQLLTGLDANVAVWQHTRYGFLLKWLRWPIIRQLADALYDRWAIWRYRRLYGDQFREDDNAA
jgi:predicted DCC family thiol-disulfide oxidoreductase YuxK